MEEETEEEDLKDIEITTDEGEMLFLGKTSPNYNKEEHEQHTSIHVCMLVIQIGQDPTPSFPIKPIPSTSIQDLSCSGPKLAQFTPSKQNPNPPLIHSF